VLASCAKEQAVHKLPLVPFEFRSIDSQREMQRLAANPTLLASLRSATSEPRDQRMTTRNKTLRVTAMRAIMRPRTKSVDDMSHQIDRRTFLLSSLALARAARAQGLSLETFLQWKNASRPARAAALPALLDRIRTVDADIHAWVQVLPQEPLGSGPLSGIPFAVKDVIETKDLATEYGSPVYKGRVGTSDASVVRELRMRGGILLGKTHTAAFAYRHPAPTRNPRNTEHTPGGSSSGSAAAVAAGMVPVAIGTQTGGSVLRPASFCGIAGFKPTYGLLPTDGVLQYSKSLDTLGFFTHTAADMIAFWEACGRPIGRGEDVLLGAVDPPPPVDPEMSSAFAAALARLKAAGHRVRPLDVAPMLTRLRDAGLTISTYEGARAHENRFKQYGDRLDDVATLVRDGLKIPDADYSKATRYVAECRVAMADLYKTTPVILVPAAPGAAPRGLSSTGDARINYPFTALGTPAISIPMGTAHGLPLGLQLTADRGDDARLLWTAVAVERSLGFRLNAPAPR
jgi:Asp-tRNA(Asn)/Glu-tRNA(Gln) amidotransferase A subunit family amidase